MTEEFDPFSSESSERLVHATAALLQGLQQYVSDVRAMTGRSAEIPALFARNRNVETLVRAWNDAAIDYTGTAPLLLAERPSLGEAQLDAVEESDSTEDVIAAPLLSVVSRFDLVISNADDLLASGRAAYRRMWPDEDSDDVAVAIPSPAHALSAIMNATGEPWITCRGSTSLAESGHT